jgi:hypothetical protein
MKTPILLHIPEPCHENWDAMTNANKGRHCQSCNKIVVDFSVMSDRQVLEYFKTTTGKTCGRFHDDQLQRPLVEPQKQPSKWSYFLASFIAFIMSAKTFSQQKVGKVKFTGKPSVERVTLKGDTIEIKKDTINPKKIQGKVVDEKGKGISNAIVKFIGTINAVVTDSFGNFSIVNEREKKAIQVSANGYVTQAVYIKDGMIVKLLANNNLTDEVFINVPYGTVKMTTFTGSAAIINNGRIAGKVVDEKNNSIAGATIKLKGTRLGTSSNPNGMFEIKSLGQQNKLTLIISSIGFETNEIEVVPKDLKGELNIVLKEKKNDLEEVILQVSYGTIKKSCYMGSSTMISSKKIRPTIKDTVIKKVQQIFNRESINIYPNPATKNDIIHITIKDAGEYALHFFDTQSRLLTVKAIVTNTNNQTTEFQLPSTVATGTYFIRILNEKTPKQVTEKIIVQ